MSSFLVTADYLNVVLNAIAFHGGSGYFGGYRIRTNEDLDHLGQALGALNARAVNLRYPNTPQVTPVPFRYSPARAARDLASLARDLKAIECLTYQCDQGDALDCALGQALEAFARELTVKVAHATPEYQAARWGVAVDEPPPVPAPGPWRASNGEVIDADGESIGVVYRTEGWCSGEQVDTDDQATACLIVAAPLLLEAARSVAKGLRAVTGDPALSDLATELESAVKLATGANP